MIVTCPHCNTEYNLDSVEMPPLKHLGTGEEGWILSCGRCDHEWWLAVGGRDSQANQNAYRQFYREEGSRDFSAQKIQPTLRPKSIDGYRPPRKRNYAWMFFKWVLYLVVLGGVSFFGFTYRADLCAYWDSFSASNGSPRPASLSPRQQPLVSQNVQYDLQPSEDGQLIALVEGEIANKNSVSLPLRPLKIIVFGDCTADELGSSDQQQGQPVCVRGEWSHQLDRHHILPGERIWFKSSGVLPAGTKVIQVQVTPP
ncbi:MAG: hypothetical protein NTX76_02850 [Alphaproteobacteria bacterium]|nr:hypothetical protein [Alphaproteobacteria bacterium]